MKEIALTEDQFRYLATVCGGIYHGWKNYNDKEVREPAINQINSFFKTKNQKYFISKGEGYAMRVGNEKGMIDYVHNDWKIEDRKVTVKLKHQHL
jgi:hypothetical protein